MERGKPALSRAPRAVKAKPTVKDDAHRPEVHAGVVVLPAHHLGGHVERGAPQHVLLIPRGHVLSKAEICQTQSSWGHGEKASAPSQPFPGSCPDLPASAGGSPGRSGGCSAASGPGGRCCGRGGTSGHRLGGWMGT